MSEPLSESLNELLDMYEAAWHQAWHTPGGEFSPEMYHLVWLTGVVVDAHRPGLVGRAVAAIDGSEAATS